jgi:hypothetical protein
VYATDIGLGAIRIIKLNNFVCNTDVNINGNVFLPNIYSSTINGVYTTGTLLGTAGLSDQRIKTNIQPEYKKDAKELTSQIKAIIKSNQPLLKAI